MDDAGFKDLTRWADARSMLRSACEYHGRTERLAVADAADRILADSICAGRDVPHYDRTEVDGYAVRARDTHGASQRSPATLTATDDPESDDGIASGDAVPVEAGDVVPDGADAVVRVEFTRRRHETLEVTEAVAAGANVTLAGGDVAAREELFERGHRLRPSDVALLRAAGCEAVDAVEPSRVNVVPTGDELVAAGDDLTLDENTTAGQDSAPDGEPAPGETVETNGHLVATLAERWGGDADCHDVVSDDEDALRTAIEDDTDHDVVVTTGGTSVGERDVVADVVADAGEVLVHGVSIRPGRSVGFGVVADTPVLMLPGAPVSCLVTAVQFLRPALAWLAGTTPAPFPTTNGLLTRKIHSGTGERTFARVRFVDDGGGSRDGENEDGRSTGETGSNDPPRVKPFAVGGAGAASSVASAGGWVVVPESREGIPAGEVVAVEAWEQPEVARSNSV